MIPRHHPSALKHRSFCPPAVAPGPSARWLVIALCVLCLSAPSLAQADEDKELRAAAAARKAEKLMAQGKTVEACTKLQESLDLDPITSSALDLAQCHEKAGKLASAHAAYKRAAELAKKARSFARLNKARQKIARLKFRLARLTIRIDAKAKGLVVTLDGKPVVIGGGGLRNLPVDAGEHVIVAKAPGRVQHEHRFTIKNGQRRPERVPQLAIDDKPKTKATKAAPKTTPAEPKRAPETPDDDDADSGDGGGRLVVQASFLGGLGYGNVSEGSLDELSGKPYSLRTSEDGELLASCGDSGTIPGAGTCTASLSSALHGAVGGELLVAYALVPRLHLGARAWGMKTFAKGFAILGGPTASFQVAGPAWIGASFMLGAQEYGTTVTALSGSVPGELAVYNPSGTIDIPLSELTTTKTIVKTGLLYGGAIHISAAIFGSAPEALWSASMPHWLLDGAVHAGVDIALLKVEGGLSLFVPAHVGYRFY